MLEGNLDILNLLLKREATKLQEWEESKANNFKTLNNRL
jgi:hypothetical protein